MPDPSPALAWPPLPLESWQDTLAALHRWTQIVGKLRVACTPWTNHSWHATLYLTARGLTTSPMACDLRTLQVDFDFLDHRLLLQTSDGANRWLALRPQSTAQFHADFLRCLGELGIEVAIGGRPNEIAGALPFAQDVAPRPYDGAAAQRFWRILLQSQRVFQHFRARFRGKCSPVHFFWGAADLALTRFSGRAAPPHPGRVPEMPDWIVREAYSHEVSSCGFWPGGGPVPYPAFYSYAYPEPEGFRDWTVQPAQAFYSRELGEFILPYEAVRSAADPDATLLAFLQDSYEAAAVAGRWDRAALECSLP